MRQIMRLLPAIFVLSLVRAEPPDIVIVLADDMGYSDIGCFGGEVKTPVIDALAANGLRFTRFYNASRCCPSRASLLTGLYPHQAGVGHMVEDRGKPGYRGRLNERCVTIAEVLRASGYHTAMAGKWHVTPFDYETRGTSDRASCPSSAGLIVSPARSQVAAIITCRRAGRWTTNS